LCLPAPQKQVLRGPTPADYVGPSSLLFQRPARFLGAAAPDVWPGAALVRARPSSHHPPGLRRGHAEPILGSGVRSAMCRVLSYIGPPVLLDDLLYQPDSSLVRQSYDPQQLHMLNLGGFGMMAWDAGSADPDR